MKKLILILLFGLCPLSVFAGKIKESTVPEAVKTYVKKNFPNASNIKWDYEDDGFYEAEFKISGKKHELEISPEGKLIFAKIKVDTSTLPGEIKKYLDKKYEDYSILGAKKLIRSGESGSTVTFDVGIRINNRHRNLHFDEQGKYLK